MRCLLVAAMALSCLSAVADGGVTIRGPVTFASAQDAAEVLASRGRFEHTGCRLTEGIGFSRSSPDDAIRRCCFWGQRKPLDIGVAWSPAKGGWIAVVRYR
jgi:hypothetical protein